jgi:hypothetical protein
MDRQFKPSVSPSVRQPVFRHTMISVVGLSFTTDVSQVSRGASAAPTSQPNGSARAAGATIAVHASRASRELVSVG